jgi:hypothetical protein
MLVVAIDGWSKLGIGLAPPALDEQYMETCRWARDNTPIDAIFLVPPGETEFRLYGQRAIVVNFKHVPQLGGEMPEWISRLQAVLGTDDLDSLPRGYNDELAALSAKYESQTPEAMMAVAKRYGARFIIADHHLDAPNAKLVFQSSASRYFVYDLSFEAS